MIYSDLKLSQKLELTEARANVAFVEARRAARPASGAEWIEVAGARAMFDGVESPLTQTFGLGIFEEASPADLDRLEEFFKSRAAPIYHEVSPLAGLGLVRLLNERGYRPCEMTSVMFREIGASNEDSAANPRVASRVIEPGEAETWARTSAHGWATEIEGIADFMHEFGLICARADGGHAFLAELENEPISAGMLYIFDDVALLGGACTVPEGRRRGGQGSLLAARLAFAAARGCRLAMMCALPGSQSQRNAEKNDFRIAYTRTKWELG